MNIKKLSIFLIFLSCIVLVILYKRISDQANIQQAKPYVVCTTNILGDAILKIAGNTIKLDVLMGPGVDPHVYKPIENDLLKIAQADLVVYHGLHLEACMADLFEHLGATKKTVAATKNINTRDLISVNDQHTMFDPHVWFDPKLWIIVAGTIAEHLCMLIPDQAHIFNHNKDVFTSQISQTYQASLSQLEQIPPTKRFLITSHDAFSYFARAYDFNVISLQGINTASQAGVRDVQEMVNLILTHQIPTIFVESSVPPRSMQAIQERVKANGQNVSIGHELFSDSLGDQSTPEGSYIGMLNYNIDSILQGLSTSK